MRRLERNDEAAKLLGSNEDGYEVTWGENLAVFVTDSMIARARYDRYVKPRTLRPNPVATIEAEEIEREPPPVKYGCGCPGLSYLSTRYRAWERLNRALAIPLQERRKGDWRPDDWPSSWKGGRCTACGQVLHTTRVG